MLLEGEMVYVPSLSLVRDYVVAFRTVSSRMLAEENVMKLFQIHKRSEYLVFYLISLITCAAASCVVALKNFAHCYQ